MNLAISDLLVGLGVMPFVALSIVKPGWGECFVRHFLVSEPSYDFIHSFFSPLTEPVPICGLHLLCLLHSFCSNTGCHRFRPLPLHHGLPALQLPLHPVEDVLGGRVDLAAGHGNQLPPTAGLELCGLCDSRIQLCSGLDQQSQLHGHHDQPLLRHACHHYPCLLCEHRQSSP